MLIRIFLNLKAGDELVYQINGKRVSLSKLPIMKGTHDPFRVFKEWNSLADRQAYGDL